MAWPTSTAAFDDLRSILDRGLASDKGVKVNCKTHGSAIQLRAKFNYFRRLDRQANSKVYAEEDPRRGRSVYDSLSLRVPKAGEPDDYVIFIEKRSADNFLVEEIT